MINNFEEGLRKVLGFINQDNVIFFWLGTIAQIFEKLATNARSYPYVAFA